MASEAPLRVGDWITEQGGIVHRRAAFAAGHSLAGVRAEVRAGDVLRIGHSWLATRAAPDDLLTAARAGGRLACVSAARRRGWWIPEGVSDAVHVRMDPHGTAPRLEVVPHWTRQLAPPAGFGLVESIEDSLQHIAGCLSEEDARVIWESAIREEGISLDALRRVRWRTPAARRYAESSAGLSDSGLESLFIVRLGPWGIPMVHQAIVAGHRVDFLIGGWLVVQIDGFAHHSKSPQRTKDVALDAELTLRGYLVLRFTYAQVVHDWPTVERIVARAIATGAHRAPQTRAS